MANTRFFSQIPAWVDELDNVSDFQVRLLGFIYTVSNTGNQAFPSNSFLAKKYHKSASTVQHALSDLYQKGLLKSTPKYVDGTNRIEKRYLEIVEPHYHDLNGMAENGGTSENGHTPTPNSDIPPSRKRTYPMSKIGTDNRLLNRLPNKSVYTEGNESVLDPMMASKMLAAYNKATGRNNQNTGTFSSLAMKNVSLEDFQDVLNYMVATFSNIEYITVRSLVSKFEQHLDSANERGFVGGAIPEKKVKTKPGQKQEPPMAKNEVPASSESVDMQSVKDMLKGYKTSG
ncbi:DNA replication protein DnaD (DnaD) [Fructobacillus fructosus]|nr:DNA replication protein DnaD (DnaD) [Fructobacillus fructosus]CAK1252185.1 DNA replication protein DnaD (DnaD) [Fructobacillus fructosus]